MSALFDKTRLTSPTATEANFQDEIGRLWDVVSHLFSNGDIQSATLATDTFTATKGHIKVDTEGATASDNLATIGVSTIGS